MTQMIILPHAEYCPDGAVLEAPVGESICEVLLNNGIEIEHGKILIYITEHRLDKAVLETALASSLWLAETIDEVTED